MYVALLMLACSPFSDDDDDEDIGYRVEEPPPELVGLKELELKVQSSALTNAVSGSHTTSNRPHQDSSLHEKGRCSRHLQGGDTSTSYTAHISHTGRQRLVVLLSCTLQSLRSLTNLTRLVVDDVDYISPDTLHLPSSLLHLELISK
jgi:hypothetical protein